MIHFSVSYTDICYKFYWNFAVINKHDNVSAPSYASRQWAMGIELQKFIHFNSSGPLDDSAKKCRLWSKLSKIILYYLVVYLSQSLSYSNPVLFLTLEKLLWLLLGNSSPSLGAYLARELTLWFWDVNLVVVNAFSFSKILTSWYIL